MADGERSALGLSIGATNLAAVTADRAVTRKPVLTLYRQRPPEVGVPSENPKLNEPGVVINDFVDRVGSSVGIAAADGTTHRSETLVADALRALAYTAIDGGTLPDAVAVTHPVHWAPAAVDAVRVAMSRASEWSRGRLVLLPDSVAALFALRANPGLPSRGTVAVCDFGGSGTTLTLFDAESGYEPIAPAIRHAEFSGDRIDQALLTHVLADLSSAGSFDTAATSAIGSLAPLRGACRFAKERLSSTIATEVTADVPGYQGEIRLTRDDLDDAIRQPLEGFTNFVREILQRNGIRPEELVAIASVGGGASIPLVTTTLSEKFGALVITAPRPYLTAALGAALWAARGPADGDPAAGSTAMAPTAAGSVADLPTRSEVVADSGPAPALAWSEADDDSGIMPIRAGEYSDDATSSPLTAAGTPANFDVNSAPIEVADVWYRRPVVVAVGTALAVLAIGSGVLIAVRHTSDTTPNAPTSGVNPTPANPGAPANTDTQTPVSTAPPSDTATPSSTTSSATTTTTTTEAPTTTTTTAPTTTAPSTTREPDRPRFPRRPDGARLFPLEPGYR
jgi:actin-like ATPase involved in cell morphogenesis